MAPNRKNDIWHFQKKNGRIPKALSSVSFCHQIFQIHLVSLILLAETSQKDFTF
jgi:hypothetical protein